MASSQPQRRWGIHRCFVFPGPIDVSFREPVRCRLQKALWSGEASIELAARRDPHRPSISRGLQIRRQKKTPHLFFRKRRWFHSSPALCLSPCPAPPLYSGSPGLCKALLSSLPLTGLGRRRLTGVSLPVAWAGALQGRCWPVVLRLCQQKSERGMACVQKACGHTVGGVPGSRPGWNTCSACHWGQTAQPPRLSCENGAPIPLSLPPALR